MASRRRPLCRHRMACGSVDISRAEIWRLAVNAGVVIKHRCYAPPVVLTLVYVNASAEAAVHYFTVTRCLCYLHLLLRPCAKYCDEHVCLSVCPTGYLRNHTRDLYQFFAHVAHVRGSVRLRPVDDRPHRLSWGNLGRG